ncbi:MAG: WxcM-like domain-containing protein [Methanocalculus sp.]|uniref:polysaccharide biosynthesis C-terminal domain-containing protein n=1 Tax=Methanocalculus sp. TaxID=2004547 RepID=UPI00271E228A|nr:WxcM-like domain-containing protein [Methanocalculus sp.]MDO9540141.1 WxcM-like domain-containing protein [Methanocalculus sp.]
MDDICLKREKHIRDDGWLCELVSSKYSDEPFTGIHTYVVSVNPGCSRADHYHQKKEEWISITSGRVILSLEWVQGGRREEIVLDAESEECRIIYIMPFVAHKIQNVSQGSSSIIVFSKMPEEEGDTIPYYIG